jgi:hypothetical protein
MSLGASEPCGSGPTLALWRSEEEMYDFGTSPAHVAALGAVIEILQPGYAVTHWDATSAAQLRFAEAVPPPEKRTLTIDRPRRAGQRHDGGAPRSPLGWRGASRLCTI